MRGWMTRKCWDFAGMNVKGKGGPQNKSNGVPVTGHSTKQTFLFTFMFFSLVFFHISILVLNGLLKWWWILWLNCYYYSYWRARGSIVCLCGERRDRRCWNGGAVMLFIDITLLFEPIDTQTPFGIKKYSNNPRVALCLCCSGGNLAAFLSSCLLLMPYLNVKIFIMHFQLAFVLIFCIFLLWWFTTLHDKRPQIWRARVNK